MEFFKMHGRSSSISISGNSLAFFQPVEQMEQEYKREFLLEKIKETEVAYAKMEYDLGGMRCTKRLGYSMDYDNSKYNLKLLEWFEIIKKHVNYLALLKKQHGEDAPTLDRVFPHLFDMNDITIANERRNSRCLIS